MKEYDEFDDIFQKSPDDYGNENLDLLMAFPVLRVNPEFRFSFFLAGVYFGQ